MRAIFLVLTLAAFIGCGERDPYREILTAQPAHPLSWIYDTAPNAWTCKDPARLDFFVGEVKEVITYYQLAKAGATFRLFDLDLTTGKATLVWERTPESAGTWRELVANVRVKRGWYSVQVPHVGDKISGLLVR